MVSQLPSKTNTVANMNGSGTVMSSNLVALQAAEDCADQGLWQEAIAHCQRSLEQVETAAAYKLLGNVFLRTGELREARIAYEKALKLQPNWAEVYANLGTVATQQGRWLDAVRLKRQALVLKPEMVELDQNIDRLWEEIGASEQSLQIVATGLSDAPAEFAVADHVLLGDRWLISGKADLAVICYQRAIGLDAQAAAAYWNLAAALKQLGDLEAVVEPYAQALKLRPEWGTVAEHCQLGNEWLQREEWEQAIGCFEGAIGQGAGWQAWHGLGDALSKVERWHDAVEAYGRAIEGNSEHSWSHNNLGDVLMQLQRWEDAVGAYERAIELKDDFHWSHFNSGEALTKLGCWDEAIEAYRRGLALQPGNSLGYQKLAGLMTTRSKVYQEEALQFYWQAIESNPDNLQSYHQALELQPNNAKLHLHLSEALERQGRVDQARIFRQLSQQQPDCSDIPKPEEIKREQENCSDISKPEEIKREQENFQSFDWKFYIEYNGDLTCISNEEEAYRHWINSGQNEVRISSLKHFCERLGIDELEVPQNFNHEEYIKINPDLKGYKDKKYEALKHYLEHGKKEGRLYSFDQMYFSCRRVELSGKVEKPRNLKTYEERVAVFVHLYYFELWSELRYYIQNLSQVSHDLFVNIVESIWTPEIHNQIRLDFPSCHILVTENRGRDIGGYLALMGQIKWNDYDIFCFLHTKKSPHLEPEAAKEWRTNLLDGLLGSQERVRVNLNILRNCDSIGILSSYRCRNTSIHENTSHYFQLLDEFNIEPRARTCEYVAGTMMMIRPEIIKPIYDKFHDLNEFKVADGQSSDFFLDGQLEHALERLIGNLACQYNMQFYWQE